MSSVDVMTMTVKNIFSAKIMYNVHCVKSVQILSYFWSVFFCIQTQYGEMLHISPHSVRIYTEKHGPEITLYLDSFHAVAINI